MKNTIANRIADFLKNFAPFSTLSNDDLLDIVGEIKVITLEKNQTLFQVNDILHDSFYIVASGIINLSVISDAEETLLNRCKPGDIFGLRPFFAKNNYMMTAKSRDESVVYALHIDVFRPIVAKYTDVLNFLLESFATNTQNPGDNRSSAKFNDNIIYSGQQSEIQYFQTLEYNREPLKTYSGQMVKDVAQMMTDHMIDNVIVEANGLPIGIVTDTDLRTKIANGRYPITIAVDKIMSAPVMTVPENVSLAEAQLLLLKYNVSHLCVTADGTDTSQIRGIISEHDLIVAQANNPGVLIKEIKRSQNATTLQQVRQKLSELIRTSISKNIPLPHISNIASEINLAIIRRSIELAILNLGSPPARFAWLSLGSQGRKEQLLFTDQDSILIFEDVAEEKYRDVREYFVKLAKRITATLQQTGYPACPHGHMANNLSWCKSLSEWFEQYESWIKNPGKKGEKVSGIFFDFEIVFGDSKLEEAITNIVFSNAANNATFFDYLGNDALKKPSPLTFFKKFNVDEEGEHKDLFDIKRRALMPLIDGARLLVLSQGIRGINNTWLRFKQLAMQDSKHSETYLNCAEAFLILSKFRTIEGLKNDNAGEYINLEELSKNDREKLKNAFEPMKDLEDIIKNRFRLTQFS